MRTTPGIGRVLPCLLMLLACGGPDPALDAGAGDAGAPDASLPPQGPLRIATWNLEFFPRDPTTIERVATLIEAERLDMIAVQEISDPAPFFELAGRLRTHDAVVAQEGPAFLRVGLLVRRDRLEATAVDTLFLDDPNAFPRPVLSAALRVRPESGVPSFDFRVLVVHLKAGIGADDQARRGSALQTLDRYVQGELAAPEREHDIIILGDFNDSMIDVSPDNVFSPMFDRPDVYSLLTLPLEESGERTFLRFEAFLDHVVMTRDTLDEYGAGEVQVRHLELELPEYPFVVSDHLPVFVTFAPR